jgi:hypothetical protein
MTKHLEALAIRMTKNPKFLASPLAAYALSEDLDDAALAMRLNCTRENLTMIRLCRSPEADRFAADIDEVATRFAADAATLAAAVRHGQAVERMRARQPEHADGMLLAARDDDRPDAEPQP